MTKPKRAKRKAATKKKIKCQLNQRKGFSVSEFADLHGVCRQSVYNELNAGRLRSYKFGRRRIIPAEESERLQEGAV